MATESMSSFSSQNTSRYQNSVMATSHGSQQFSTNQWQQQQTHLFYQQNQQHWAKYYHTAATVPKRYYHYRHLTGKSLKDGSDSEKKDSDGEGLWAVDASAAAFLGPNIWDKTLAGEGDLKYVDLDEFLSENGIPLEQQLSPPTPTQNSPPSTRGEGGEGPSNLASRRGVTSELHVNTNTKRERSPSPSYDQGLSPSSVGPPSPTDSTVSFSSTNGPDFDPRTRTFSDEELKPQPMVKKSRKQLVPDGLKDDKYWARRRKNNVAAKRSRDARRVKENQIALRASFLEKENMALKQEVEKLRKENNSLRNKLDKKAN